MGETGKGPYRVELQHGFNRVVGPTPVPADTETAQEDADMLNAAHAAARRECAEEMDALCGDWNAIPTPRIRARIAKWRTP